jgi:hypothetical protein
MVLVALMAAYLAAASLDAPRAAVLDVISRGDDASGCEPAQKRKMAASATIRKLGRIGGDDVVMAEVYDPCICGAQNCPFYAIRLTPGKPRVLLTAIGISERNADRAAPLPGLVIYAHDSALVTEEFTYAYRNGAYVPVSTYRVRGGEHAGRKPNDVPVHFAPGASSAHLTGSVALGWDDAYTFAASKGQRLVIGGVRPAGKTTLTLYGPGNVPPVTLHADVPVVLPETGTYSLHVEGTSEDDVHYALSLAIR